MKTYNDGYKKSVAAAEFLKEEKYWTNKLSGDISPSSFPYDNAKTGHQPPDERTYPFELAGPLLERLEQLQNGSIPRLHMILLSGLVILLHKVTGDNDIIVGFPIQRQDSNARFINTLLVLRNVIADHMTFKELLLQVRQTVVEAVEHQNYPLETLPFRLNRSGSEHLDAPLFNIALLIDELHDLEYLQHIPLDMIFSFSRAPRSLKGEVQYNAALYHADSIQRLVSCYEQVLQMALFDIQIPVSSISVLSPQDLQQIVSQFNDTRHPYPSDKSIPQLFEEQVRKTPQNTALVQGSKGASMNYRQLNQMSNQLARLLRNRGLTPGTPVGIMAGRSPEMIVGLMAILKAGGAYLPIDPLYPEQRKTFMLHDSHVTWLLTQQKYTIHDEGIEVLHLDDRHNYQGNHRNLNLQFHPLAPAYVIYTSGTTGKPKGVQVGHRNILNYIYWKITRFELTAQDVCLQLISLSFDAFGANVYPGLLSGGKIVLADNIKQLEPHYLAGLIREEKISYFSAVPNIYRFLLENAPPGSLASLRFVVLGGEKTRDDLIRLSNIHYPQIQLINEYGPTECSVAASAYFDLAPGKNAIIGKPIANTHIYIMDKNNNIQPIGVYGELCIAGDGVARGYLNRPQLTAEKFVSTHIPHSTPARIYKTGDLARWLPDGNIQLSGRADNQVKIRGHRIELEEIQTLMSNLEQVKEALVTARKDNDGSHYLFAYFTTPAAQAQPEREQQSPAVDISVIREYLAAALPEYMVPAYFVPLAQFPLTLNGKIDHKALPEPDISTFDDYIPPRDPLEQQMVQLFAAVLDTPEETIGIRSSFFKLGGHSLKGTILAAKIKDHFHVCIPLIEIFKRQTVSALCDYLRENRHNDTQVSGLDTNLTLLKRGSEDSSNIFFIHDGSGEVEAYIQCCHYLATPFSCWGISARSLEDLMPANATIQSMARDYIHIMKNVQSQPPYILAGWSLGGAIAYEMTRQLQEAGQSTGFLALIDTYTPPADWVEEVREFNNLTEIEFLHRLAENHLEALLDALHQTGNIWQNAALYLETHPKGDALLDRLIAGFSTPQMQLPQHPPGHPDSIRAKIHYLNRLRTIRNAWAGYKPTRRINTPLHFFKAMDTISNHSQMPWDEYANGPVITHEIQGDHYSILAPPLAVELARAFDNALKDSMEMSSEPAARQFQVFEKKD